MPTVDVRKCTGNPPAPTDTTNAIGVGYDTVVGALKTNDGTTAKEYVTTDGAQTVSNKIDADFKVLASSLTFDADVTPGLITDMAWTVVAGATYVFDADFATTMTTSAGLTLAFKLTTATLTSIRYNTYATTATDNGTAVSTTGTTTSDLTEPFNSKTAAYTRVRMWGSFVVNAGGTFSLYGCQETSGTTGDVTILLIGSTARLTRVA